MFFSNNLLFALISTDASIKNLKLAFGSILVPISLPSRIQPEYLSLLFKTNSFCLKFSISLNLGEIAIDDAKFAVSSVLKSSFSNFKKSKLLAILQLKASISFELFFFLLWLAVVPPFWFAGPLVPVPGSRYSSCNPQCADKGQRTGYFHGPGSSWRIGT